MDLLFGFQLLVFMSVCWQPCNFRCCCTAATTASAGAKELRLSFFSLSLSLFSSSSRCCCAGPSLVGDSSLSLCHATLPAFPTGRWGRRKREREREKKRVGNNPSSDSWICEPFADADRTLLVIYFLFFIFFTSISSVAFKPFLLPRLHH